MPSSAMTSGRSGLGRPVLMVAAVAGIALVLLLLPHLDDTPTAPAPSDDLPTSAAFEQCLAAGPEGCAIPELRQCLQDGSVASCPDLRLAAPAASDGGAGPGDVLLVWLVVLAPFVLVLGPLGWRAVRRTKRRNADAFAAERAALEALGFVAEDDPTPSVFALDQARRRAIRALVRDGTTRIWLFEVERPFSLAFDGWPIRSAVLEPALPLPTGALVPMRERKGTARYRGTFGRSPESEALVRAVVPVLERRRGQVSVVVRGGLIELRSTAPPRTEPVALSVLADLAVELVAALDALGADAPV